METYPLSQEKYVQKGGDVCPFCGSIHIEGLKGADLDYGCATADIQCCSCNSIWRELYTLVGYETITLTADEIRA